MAPSSQQARPQAGGDSRREERTHRILDAAGELVLRLGYDKTTIDDVARRADVAKGTIYLHWNTREALFAALLRRERVVMLDEVKRDITNAPYGATLRELVRHLALALLRRPLVKAVFLGDATVLGKLVRQKPNSETTAALRPYLESYLETLRQQGAIRTELSPPEQVNVMMGTLHGFFLIPALMPDDYKLPDERLAELLADTVHRALEPGREVSSDEARAISRATLEYLDLAVQVAGEKLQRSLEGQGKDGAS